VEKGNPELDSSSLFLTNKDSGKKRISEEIDTFEEFYEQKTTL